MAWLGLAAIRTVFCRDVPWRLSWRVFRARISLSTDRRMAALIVERAWSRSLTRTLPSPEAATRLFLWMSFAL